MELKFVTRIGGVSMRQMGISFQGLKRGIQSGLAITTFMGEKIVVVANLSL